MLILSNPIIGIHVVKGDDVDRNTSHLLHTMHFWESLGDLISNVFDTL